MELFFYYVLHYGPELCGQWITPSPYSEFTQSLICGTKLSAGPERELFIDTGLIHILVVSGAHLHFLERCLIFLPPSVRVSFLACYCWLTGFGPPIVRSFVRHVLDSQLRERRFTALQKEAITSLLCLTMFPFWISSRSFLMSWMCALALAVPLKNDSVWWRSGLIFLFLYGFCLSSPLTIATNALISPLIGATLFPFCLITMVWSEFVLVTDFMWLHLITVLEWFQIDRPSFFIETRWLIWLPWLAQILLVWGEIQWRRYSSFLPR